jgi:hypothetical protein
MAKKRKRSSGSPQAPEVRIPVLIKPEREYHRRILGIVMASIPPAWREGHRGLLDGGTILFPHRTHGEPPLAAVLTGAGELVVAGMHPAGGPFTLDPDPSSAALIRQDIVKANDRSKRLAKGLTLDAETGVPVA